MTRRLRCPMVLIVAFAAVLWTLQRSPATPHPEATNPERLLLRRLPTTSDPAAVAPNARQSTTRRAMIRAIPSSDASHTPLDTARPENGPPPPSIQPTAQPAALPADEAPRPSAAAAAPAASNGQTAPVTRRSHRVVDGDDLPTLAAKYLGDGDRYLEIFHANQQVLTRPDVLPLGVELRIPDAP